MIGNVLGKLICWTAYLLILAIFMIFLGGACWGTLTIWKAIFAFFA